MVDWKPEVGSLKPETRNPKEIRMTKSANEVVRFFVDRGGTDEV
jgi:hypothetical protein